MVGSEIDHLQGESRGRPNQKFIARFMFNKPLPKKKGAAVERDGFVVLPVVGRCRRRVQTGRLTYAAKCTLRFLHLL